MKKILFVTIRSNPFDPTYGGAQRSRLLLDACASLGDVDVVMFNCGKDISSAISNCRVVYSDNVPMVSLSMGRKEKILSLLHYADIYSYFGTNKVMEKIIDSIIAKGNYDYIVVRYLAETIQMGLGKYGKRLIVDIDDHPQEALMLQSKHSRSVFNRTYLALRARLIPFAMKSFIQSIKGAYVPNEKYIDLPNMYYLPNVSYNDVNNPLPDIDSKVKKILFVGKLDYAPNHVGLTHFVQNVWPLIIERFPDAELDIVGKDAGTIDLTAHYTIWKNSKNVNVIGFVDDISLSYKECYMTISPIYEGSGTNIKVIESAQMKRACVTTTCGVRGLERFFENRKEILVASGDKEYAELVISLLQNPSFNNEMAMRAYEKADTYFSKKIFREVLLQTINSNN